MLSIQKKKVDNFIGIKEVLFFKKECKPPVTTSMIGIESFVAETN